MDKNGNILTLRLYENGIDFINKSMESYQQAVDPEYPNFIEHKYAILFLATGSELILKSLLEDKHPLFIQRNIDESNELTVQAEKLIPRINKVYSDENKRIVNEDEKSLVAIRNARNSIIHRDVIFNKENNPIDLYARTLYSLDRIVKLFKGKTLSKEVDNWESVVNIEHIQQIYYSRAKGLSFGNIEIPCAVCSIKKLVKNGSDKVKCLHCGHIYKNIHEAIFSLEDEDLIEELFQEYIQDKASYNSMECPKCRTHEYASYDKNTNQIICFRCGPVDDLVLLEDCKSCNSNTAIFLEHEIGNGIIEKITHCLNCGGSNDNKHCKSCDEKAYNLQKIKIDIRRTSKFEEIFPTLNITDGSAFIKTEVCPFCYNDLLDLEDKEVINLI